MKKFWIVMLALGLVAGFAMSASAADVKFSGSYYVAGIYSDSVSLNKDQNNNTGNVAGPQAFYYQRLRVETTFKVAEGLNLVTRFDALERRWGDTAWRGTEDTYNRTAVNAAGTMATATSPAVSSQIQENIEFERAYLDFTTKIGRFQVGYLNFVSWGTEFHDTNLTRAGIKWFIPIGPFTVIAAIEQGADKNVGVGGGNVGNNASDADSHTYDLGVIYKFGAGDAGLIYQKGMPKGNRTATAGQTVATAAALAANNSEMDLNIFIPYAKVKFGPVFVEGEAIAGFGDLRKFDNSYTGTASGIKAEQYALYLHAKADIGPAYVGGRFVYISGDDPKTTDKVEGGLMTTLKSGDAFNPCLYMFNTEYTKWVGVIGSLSPSAKGFNPYTGTPGGMDTYWDNVWMYQIYGGFKPTPKLDLMASVTYAYADKKPFNVNGASASSATAFVQGQEFLSDVYGTEIDLTAKYKIFDNLEYMLGGAYFITGDFFKGTDPNFSKKDNYMLIHKLTLTF